MSQPITVQQLLNKGWVPDGHRKRGDEYTARPHLLEPEGCWCLRTLEEERAATRDMEESQR